MIPTGWLGVLVPAEQGVGSDGQGGNFDGAGWFSGLGGDGELAAIRSKSRSFRSSGAGVGGFVDFHQAGGVDGGVGLTLVQSFPNPQP